jgi:hypothetical protein
LLIAFHCRCGIIFVNALVQWVFITGDVLC